MKTAWSTGAAALLFYGITSSALGAAEIKILSLPPLRSAMAELIPQYEKSVGHKISIEYGTPPQLLGSLKRDDSVDLVIATKQIIEKLRGEGRISNAREIAKVGMGMAVKKGAAKPDIGSVDSFKRALLAATSLAYIDPASGAPGGIYLTKLFEQLGIAAELQPKTRYLGPSGAEAAVASGDVQIALSQMTVMAAYPGIEIVGPLPPKIQNYLEFSVGTVSGSKNAEAAGNLIQFMSSPPIITSLRAKGFE